MPGYFDTRRNAWGGFMKDRIVDEIRNVRKKIDREIDKNPALFDREIESIRKRFHDRIFTVGPKLLKKKAA